MTGPAAEARKAAPAASQQTADRDEMMNRYQRFAAIGAQQTAPLATSLTFDTANYVPAMTYNAATITSGSGTSG